VSRERLLLEHSLYLGTQALKTSTHIRDPGSDPDPGPERKLDHLPTL